MPVEFLMRSGNDHKIARRIEGHGFSSSQMSMLPCWPDYGNIGIVIKNSRAKFFELFQKNVAWAFPVIVHIGFVS